LKNSVLDRLRAAQGCAAIFISCKLLKMGDNRKSQFSIVDVEIAMDGFFNKVLVAAQDLA